MSRLISEIINAPEPHFSHAVRNLEKFSGSNGHDIRLISDINLSRKQAIKDLNLDEKDTTAKELYFALRHRAAETNLELERRIGIDSAHSPDQVVAKIIEFIDSLSINRDVWVVKHSIIKQSLKDMPPKKTLKSLGLRSVDSMLKRNNACEMLIIASQIESQDWTNKFKQKYKKLKNTDFQLVKSSICTVCVSRAEKLAKSEFKSSQIVTPNYETGTILVVPPVKRFNLDVIAITLSILQSLYELRVYSAYFKLISVKDRFGDKFYSAATDGLSGRINEKEIGWKVLHKYLNIDKNTFSKLEQPHFQFDDIILETPIKVLSNEIPTMNFWDGYEHVYMQDERNPVSFHLLDVVTNASNGLLCENGVCVYLQQDLVDELMLRYLRHEKIQKEAIGRFE